MFAARANKLKEETSYGAGTLAGRIAKLLESRLPVSMSQITEKSANLALLCRITTSIHVTNN